MTDTQWMKEPPIIRDPWDIEKEREALRQHDEHIGHLNSIWWSIIGFGCVINIALWIIIRVLHRA